MPEKSETITKEDAEIFLKQPIDVDIPFCEMLSTYILDNKRIAKTSLKAAKPLRQLTSIILGEKSKVAPKKRSLFSFGS